MSDFSFKMQSIGGAVTGYLPGTEKMGNAYATTEPQESTGQMAVWQPGKFDSEGVYQEWERAYTHTYFHILDCYTLPDLCDALYNGGYRTEQGSYEVCRFAVNDEYGHPLLYKTLSLLCWSPSNSNIYVGLYRRESVNQGQTWTFTPVSIQESWNENIGSSAYGFQCGRFTRNNKLWYAFGICALGYSDRQCEAYLFMNTHDNLVDIIGGVPAGEDLDTDFGPESAPEGYTGGSFDDHSDVIDLPPKPQSILSLGFINVYKCEANALVDFGAELFPEIRFPQSLSDVGEVLAAVSDSIWNSKLIDYVISVHCVPGNVPSGNLEDIKVGARTMTGIMARKITNEYVDFDFGSISVAPYYNNYVDYITQIQLYLPMYGFISLKPEEIIGGSIHLVYRFNVIDGSFQAFVFATSNRSKLHESLIGQYGGSCVVHLPVSNLSYSTMFSTLIGGAMTAAGVAAGAATGMAGAMAATSLFTQSAQGGDVKKSNSYNASASFMSRLKPYVIVTRPISSFSPRYNIENGLPSNVSRLIGSCSGLTICESPILNFGCTEELAKEIIAALKEGVIV